MKKLIIIISIIIITALIGWVIYYFVTKDDSQIIDITNNNNPNFPTNPDNDDSEVPEEINQDEINIFNDDPDIFNSLIASQTDGKLQRITDSNTISFYVGGQNDRGDTFINYIEAGTGHVYSYDVRNQEDKRISNKTIPRILEAIWGNENNIIVRYIDDEELVKSYAGIIESSEIFDSELGTTTEMSLEGTFLQDNIEQIAVSPNGREIYYLKDRSGYKTSFANPSESRELFNTKIQDWNLYWPISGSLVLSTKPSDGIPGYAYSLNPNSASSDNNLSKIIGPIDSLSLVWGDTLNTYIYSESRSGIVKTNYRLGSNSGSLGFDTLAEKCVIGVKNNEIAYCAVPNQYPSAKYPDDWYKGRLAFNDSIFFVNLRTGGVSIVYDISNEININLDIVEPKLNEDDTLLVFRDKNTGNIWSLNLEPEEEF